MKATSELINPTYSPKRFTLQEVLNDDREFLDYFSRRVWHRVKSSPNWEQWRNAGEQLEGLAKRLSSLEAKLDLILECLNGDKS